MKSSAAKYHFGSWSAAVEAAGLTPIDPMENVGKRDLKITDDDLLLDLLRLHKETGRTPTEALVNSTGQFSSRPYRKRFGGIWKAFLLAQNRFPDAVCTGHSHKPEPIPAQTIKMVPETIKPKVLLTKRRRFVLGEPIDFRGLRFAPVNEQGVVYLFGMISHELGYLIESVRTEYPDCEGKRCFDKEKNKWEDVRIEFEYKSSHFLEHGHNENECEIIVCWIHDWEDCPIEVLELRNIIKFL